MIFGGYAQLPSVNHREGEVTPFPFLFFLFLVSFFETLRVPVRRENREGTFKVVYVFEVQRGKGKKKKKKKQGCFFSREECDCYSWLASNDDNVDVNYSFNNEQRTKHQTIAFRERAALTFHDCPSLVNHEYSYHYTFVYRCTRRCTVMYANSNKTKFISKS